MIFMFVPFLSVLRAFLRQHTFVSVLKRLAMTRNLFFPFFHQIDRGIAEAGRLILEIIRALAKLAGNQLLSSFTGSRR